MSESGDTLSRGSSSESFDALCGLIDVPTPSRRDTASEDGGSSSEPPSTNKKSSQHLDTEGSQTDQSVLRKKPAGFALAKPAPRERKPVVHKKHAVLHKKSVLKKTPAVQGKPASLQRKEHRGRPAAPPAADASRTPGGRPRVPLSRCVALPVYF